MPWKESCIMEERLKFIVEARGGVAGIAELARAYGVSRKTAYKWLGRYEEAGAPGLLERSRAPHSMPWAVPEEVAALIVALRKRRPTWGPRKLLAALEGEQLGIKLPAASTVAELLSRRGLVVHRRRARRTPLYQGPFTACRAANQVWCADFKGHFLLGNHRVCHPLTITDAFSRYLLRCEGLSRTGEPDVRPQFDSAFREFGLPEAIRTDNGAPFATTAPAGLSKLAIWWVKLGIRPERIEPGKPTQNGRHERFHRTLQQETAAPPAATMAAQQRAFDDFRVVYNDERPHEALGQHPPASKYTPSARSYPTKLREPEYGDEAEVRRVRPKGHVKWRGQEVFVSEALRGEPVGIVEVADGQWAVHFGPLLLGHFDDKGRFNRPRPGKRPSQVATEMKVSPMSPG
jgi:transposase InsO family protein